MIAVVGCGYWGKNLVRVMSELGALTTICDIDKKTVTHLTKEHKVQSDTWEGILADDKIKGVMLATPAKLHGKMVCEALEADKHVFVEKPLSMTTADARMILALSKKHNKQVMVGHLIQYHPAFIKLKEKLSLGLVGKLNYVNASRLSMMQLYREENVFWDFAPHDISIILGLMGALPTSIQASSGAYRHGDVHDVANIQMTFPKGEQASISLSWIHPVKEQKLTVVGDKGMLVFDDTKSWNKKLMHVPAQEQPYYIPLERQEPLGVECQHFIDCVLDNKTPLTNVVEGLPITQIIEQAIESANTQSRVEALL